MELVYIWIEKYKNIDKQGFNFSHRYKCDYDKKKDKLTIAEQSHVNIFPDNINITAIVGENGSGKSSILEAAFGWIKEDSFLCLYKVHKKFYLVNKLSKNTQIISKEDVHKKEIAQFGYIRNMRLYSFSNNLFKDNMSFTYSDRGLRNFAYRVLKNKMIDRENSLMELLNNEMTLRLISFIKECGNKIPFSFDNVLIELSYSEKERIHPNILKSIRRFKEEGNNRYYIPIEDFNDTFLNEKYNWSIKFSFTKSLKGLSQMYSQGEVDFLFLLSEIYKECKDSVENKSEQNVNKVFIFDEIISSYHPEWQREFIYKLTDFINKNFKGLNFHIIVITHSPFILSDLSKENVIFLKNGKQVDPFKNKQTFGANIHSLLSDGFFMDKGLIGEFSRMQIQNVIDFLNNKDTNLSKEDVYPIIELIAEPFLKENLKRQYFKKYPKDNLLDEEILFHMKKLEELNNLKR